MSEITYHKKNDEIECVRYRHSRKCYAPHTHTGHLVVPSSCGTALVLMVQQ